VRFPDGPLTDGVVTLRLWEQADAAWYVEQTRDPDILRFTAEPADLTEQAVRDAIAEMMRTRAAYGAVVTDAVTGELLGNAGLAPVPDDPEAGALAYWVVPAARGRGVATRAVLLLTELARELGLSRVELHAHIDNIGSQRVAERAGFTRGRVVPDHRVVKGESWTVVFYDLSLS
jgi:[ribosomal protein S5]-alanine N-acetyltransferase